MEIKEIMLEEKKRLMEQLQLLQNKYSKEQFPEGRISFSKNGNNYKFYKLTDSTREYITSAEKETVKNLLLKRYYNDKLAAYEKEIKAIDSYLRKSPKDPDDMIRKNPYFKKILPDLWNTDRIYGAEWSDNEYEKNDKYPENLIIKTLKGDMVRSKSEAMIADELFRAGISYRYEEKMIELYLS